MRPPDENQHGSTRPNLLSGSRRRSGGDDNILERLERDSARQASGDRSRAAWYAASASLVLLLIVLLAWMAYDNASTVRVVPMSPAAADNHTAVVLAPPEPATPAAPGAVDMAVPPPLPSVAQVPPTPASLPGQPPAVIQPHPAQASAPGHPYGLPASANAGVGAGLPPLVLLRAHEVTPEQPAAPAKSATVALPGATVPVQPAARDIPPAPSATRVIPRAASVRARKAGPDVAPPEAPVDTDVALLSAIIIHDSTHAAEKAQLEATVACTRAGARKCAAHAGAGP